MNRIKPVFNVHVDPTNLETLHASVEKANDAIFPALNSIIQSEIIGGNLLSGIELTTSATRVPHKLGRKPLGYIVVRRNASATVYEQVESREDLFLNLIASGAVTVSLWVF